MSCNRALQKILTLTVTRSRYKALLFLIIMCVTSVVVGQRARMKPANRPKSPNTAAQAEIHLKSSFETLTGVVCYKGAPIQPQPGVPWSDCPPGRGIKVKATKREQPNVPAEYTAVTNWKGRYTMRLPPGNYAVRTFSHGKLMVLNTQIGPVPSGATIEPRKVTHLDFKFQYH
jgi:hypothetical protein